MKPFDHHLRIDGVMSIISFKNRHKNSFCQVMVFLATRVIVRHANSAPFYPHNFVKRIFHLILIHLPILDGAAHPMVMILTHLDCWAIQHPQSHHLIKK